MPFPCDRYVDRSDDAYFRAIDVDAPAEVLFRWLCQLKVGSYSYDWLDRLERMLFNVRESIPPRPSPEGLLSGVERLAPGESVMGVFKLVEFEVNRHITILLQDQRAIAIFGEIAASYVLLPRSAYICRLIMKGHVRYPRHFLAAGMRAALPWADLLMMRQQFLRLKRLAEAQRSGNRGHGRPVGL